MLFWVRYGETDGHISFIDERSSYTVFKVGLINVHLTQQCLLWRVIIVIDKQQIIKVSNYDVFIKNEIRLPYSRRIVLCSEGSEQIVIIIYSSLYFLMVFFFNFMLFFSWRVTCLQYILTRPDKTSPSLSYADLRIRCRLRAHLISVVLKQFIFYLDIDEPNYLDIVR